MFERGDFVRETGGAGRVALVMKIESRFEHQDKTTADMSRYTIMYVDGGTLSNAPGYLYRAATEMEIQTELRCARGSD